MRSLGAHSLAVPIQLGPNDWDKMLKAVNFNVNEPHNETTLTRPHGAANEDTKRLTTATRLEQIFGSMRADLLSAETERTRIDDALSNFSSSVNQEILQPEIPSLSCGDREPLMGPSYKEPSAYPSYGALLLMSKPYLEDELQRIVALGARLFRSPQLSESRTYLSNVIRFLDDYWFLLIELLGKAPDEELPFAFEELRQVFETAWDAILRKLLYYLIAFNIFWRLLGLLHEFPGKRRPPCTTMPWTIWPALVVLWGVCWMFYSSPPPNAGVSGKDLSPSAFLDDFDFTIQDYAFDPDPGFNPVHTVSDFLRGNHKPYRVDVSGPDSFVFDPMLSGPMTEQVMSQPHHSANPDVFGSTVASAPIPPASDAAAPNDEGTNVHQGSVWQSPPAQVSQHEVGTEESQEHKCLVCQETFSEERSLIRHCDEQHSGTSAKRYYCPTVTCSRHTKGFSRKLSLTRHLTRQRGCDSKRSQVMRVEVSSNRRNRSSSATAASKENTDLGRPRKKNKTTGNIGIDGVLARWKEDLKTGEAELKTKERELERIRREGDELERDIEKRKAVLEDSRKRIRDFEEANGHSEASSSTEP